MAEFQYNWERDGNFWRCNLPDGFWLCCSREPEGFMWALNKYGTKSIGYEPRLKLAKQKAQEAFEKK